jgi:LysM repeat protein
MYQFEKLPQVVDQREGLKENGEYIDFGVAYKTVRVWHHSLTKKAAKGSTAAGFAAYHVDTLGWPGCGYHFIIEPQKIIKGSDGRERARIVWVHNPGAKSYHVGNSNKFALGICVAGDYREEKLDEPTLRSISELHQALELDKIGSDDKSHREMPGYSWKDCCAYDYAMAIKFKSPAPPAVPAPLPGQYAIQEGDTFWSIAGRDGAQGVQVNDLIAANPGINPAQLQIGQLINLGQAKNVYTRPATEPKKKQHEQKYPLPLINLKKGIKDKSGAVLQLQRALIAIAFYPDKAAANKGADGSFGPMTEGAVIRFQKIYTPYAVDGLYGPETRKKLQAVLKSKGY